MGIQEDFVAAARSKLGVPYFHQGRDSFHGLDCAGLLIVCGKEIGIIPEDYDFIDYAKRNDGSDLERIILEYCTEINIEDMSPGDICTIRVMEHPQHCGIISGNGFMIHTLEEVVEHNYLDRWLSRIHKVFRING